MMNTKLNSIMAASLVCGVFSGAANAQAPVLLRMKFKAGDVSKHQMVMKMNMTMTPSPGGAAPASFPSSSTIQAEQTVAKTLPNGGGEIVTKTLSQQTTLNGQPTNAPPIGPMTAQFDARGKLLSMKGLPAMPAGMGGFGSNMITGSSFAGQLPARAVRPGDVWTQPFSIPALGGAAMARSKFVRYEQVGSYRTARIHMTIAMPVRIMLDGANRPTRNAASAAVVMFGTFNMGVDSNFAIDEGKMVRSGGNGTAVITVRPQSSGPKRPATPPITMRMAMQMSDTLLP